MICLQENVSPLQGKSMLLKNMTVIRFFFGMQIAFTLSLYLKDFPWGLCADVWPSLSNQCNLINRG
jgi:hypothetical protein